MRGLFCNVNDCGITNSLSVADCFAAAAAAAPAAAPAAVLHGLQQITQSIDVKNHGPPRGRNYFSHSCPVPGGAPSAFGFDGQFRFVGQLRDVRHLFGGSVVQFFQTYLGHHWFQSLLAVFPGARIDQHDRLYLHSPRSFQCLPYCLPSQRRHGPCHVGEFIAAQLHSFQPL